jgi:hypothetical protein
MKQNNHKQRWGRFEFERHPLTINQCRIDLNPEEAEQPKQQN